MLQSCPNCLLPLAQSLNSLEILRCVLLFESIHNSGRSRPELSCQTTCQAASLEEGKKTLPDHGPISLPLVEAIFPVILVRESKVKVPRL